MDISTNHDDKPLTLGGQPDPDGPDRAPDLGYLAEAMVATSAAWELLPETYRLFGNEFLEAALAGAGDGN